MGNWVRPGAHVNLVGAHTPTTREADTALVQKSTLYVDLIESAQNEAGEILIAKNEGAIEMDHIIGEIGRVITGDVPGRTNGEQITVYKSLGITAQDLFAAKYVLDAAVTADMGIVTQL